MGRNKPKKKPAAAAPTPPKEEPKIYEIFDSDEDEDKDIDALEPIPAKASPSSKDDKEPSDTKQGASKENDQPQANLSTKDIFAQWKGSGVWQPSSGLEHFTINDLCKTQSKVCVSCFFTVSWDPPARKISK